jgi:DHA1 family multidrug resistance protein-like MFS transporter
MIWAPLSEIPPIGRNPVYIITLLVFVCLQLAVIYADNIGMLIAFRFLTGLIGSPAIGTGGASLGDIWDPKARAYAIGMWGAVAICGPTLGPLIGGFAVMEKDWSWSIWELMWMSGFTLVFCFFCLPETSGPNILCRRARRMRRVTGNLSLRSASENEAAQASKKVRLSGASMPILHHLILCTRTWHSKPSFGRSSSASRNRLSSFSTSTSR